MLWINTYMKWIIGGNKMTFSQSLRKEVDSIWEASFHHPFVKNSVKER